MFYLNDNEELTTRSFLFQIRDDIIMVERKTTY